MFRKGKRLKKEQTDRIMSNFDSNEQKLVMYFSTKIKLGIRKNVIYKEFTQEQKDCVDKYIKLVSEELNNVKD